MVIEKRRSAIFGADNFGMKRNLHTWLRDQFDSRNLMEDSEALYNSHWVRLVTCEHKVSIWNPIFIKNINISQLAGAGSRAWNKHIPNNNKIKEHLICTVPPSCIRQQIFGLHDGWTELRMWIVTQKLRLFLRIFRSFNLNKNGSFYWIFFYQEYVLFSFLNLVFPPKKIYTSIFVFFLNTFPQIWGALTNPFCPKRETPFFQGEGAQLLQRLEKLQRQDDDGDGVFRSWRSQVWWKKSCTSWYGLVKL